MGLGIFCIFGFLFTIHRMTLYKPVSVIATDIDGILSVNLTLGQAKQNKRTIKYLHYLFNSAYPFPTEDGTPFLLHAYSLSYRS